MIPIVHREFYDVPRAFLVRRGAASYLFDCAIDEAGDEYPDVYRVYALPEEVARPAESSSWLTLAAAGHLLGTVAVAAVMFDPTRRAIDPRVLDELLAARD